MPLSAAWRLDAGISLTSLHKAFDTNAEHSFEYLICTIFIMLSLFILLFAALAAAQVSDHTFGILKQSDAGQFVVAPYCNNGQPLTLVQGIPTPAQAFRLADGKLIANVGNDSPAAVRVGADGLLAFEAIDAGSVGFAPNTDDTSVTFNGQSEFCALNGQIYINSNRPGCEMFNLQGIYYYHPATCGAAK